MSKTKLWVSFGVVLPLKNITTFSKTHNFFLSIFLINHFFLILIKSFIPIPTLSLIAIPLIKSISFLPILPILIPQLN